MATIISGHNAKVLTPAPTENPHTCNCRTPDNCPLTCSGKCLIKCVVYKATVTAPPKPVRHYYGLTEGPFKTRYYSHTHSFRTKSCKNDTELSKYIRDLQDNKQQYQVKWDIVHLAASYKCGTRQCDVCLTERMVIATAIPATMLCVCVCVRTHGYMVVYVSVCVDMLHVHVDAQQQKQMLMGCLLAH